MNHSDDIADEFAPPPPDKLFAHHRWQLSAMLDGELSPDEAKFMLRRLQHDTALAACWERWQVGGDILRGRGHALLPAEFSSRVARAIAQGHGVEAAPQVEPVARGSSVRWGGRAALAASVAVAALFVARQLPGDGVPAPSDAPLDMAATAPATVTAEPIAEADRGDPLFAIAASALAAAGVAADRRPRAQMQAAPVQVMPSAEQTRRAALEPRPAQRRAIASASQALPQASPLPLVPSLPRAESVDPFAANVITSPRPWPRTILPALAPAGALFARYGEDAAGTAFHPFEPRLQPRATAGPVEEAGHPSAMGARAEADPTESIDPPAEAP